jgi:2-methylisocitrate lyase-like PEP mutase family enzyme
VPTRDEKAERFLARHRGPTPLLLPNPWDAGSAKLLASLGFEALATTSNGFAATLGRRDGGVTRPEALDHAATIVAAVDLPVSGDLENGFGHSPDDVAETVAGAAGAGLAGCSIEDFTTDPADPIYPLDAATARIEAAADAARASGGFVLTARCENFLHGRPDLDDTVRRLKAFADAGADCLYSPGIRTREQIEATVRAVAPKPVNFLNSGSFGKFTVSDLAGLGVRRISVGGSLARVAMHAFIKTATEIANEGKFDGFTGLISNPELNKFFAEDRKKRAS